MEQRQELLEIDQSHINPADPRDWNLVPFAPRRNLPSITYSNAKAIAYARDYAHDYAAGKLHTCGVCIDEGQSADCAHFIAHCLAAGGLRVEPQKEGAVVCQHGLAMESPDILAQLKRWSQQYANIRLIDLSDVRVGDIGFLQAGQPGSAFMVSQPWNIFNNPFDTPKVWTHKGAPGCFDIDAGFRQWMTAAYRLDDA